MAGRKKTSAASDFKVTIFTDLFSNKAFLRSFYNALYPGKKLELHRFKFERSKTTLADGVVNEIAFSYGRELIILVDTPGPDSTDFIERALLAGEIISHMDFMTKELERRSRRRTFYPDYFVYSTGKEPIGQTSYSAEYTIFRRQGKIFVDSLPVNMGEKTILDDFVFLCKTFSEQYQVCGRDGKKAQKETIRICQENEILKPFLEELA